MAEIKLSCKDKMSKLAKKRKSQPTIIPIDSEDKKGLDPTPPQEHPLSMPRGSRVCLLAPPGHGKTSTIKNLLLRSSPFAAVVVISGVGEHTSEERTPPPSENSVTVNYLRTVLLELTQKSETKG